MKNPARPRSSTMIESPRRRLKSAPPAVTLWQPDVVLASTPASLSPRPAVALAHPGVRPAAVRTRLETARSVLGALADARQTLEATSALQRARAEEADSPRDHVSAVMAAYRAEARLDEVLTGAWQRVNALMEERGLR